jgi:Domain of unknown function (DUF4815)
MNPINTYKDNPLYPDRYREGSNWVRVLPVPGRAVQTSELMEVQSIIQGQMRMALSSIHRDGTPISGLRVTVNSPVGNDTEPSYSVGGGLFYTWGIVLPVEGVTSLVLGPTKTVYVVVTEKVVTEIEDSTLRDPIRGQGYGTEGAHRLIWEASIGVVPGPSSYPIATVGEGGQVMQRPLLDNSDCMELLASYTRDRMGDFLLHGLGVAHTGTRQGSGIATAIRKEELDRLNGELLEYRALLLTTNTELSKERVALETTITNATQTPSAPNRYLVDAKRKRVQELEAASSTISAEVNAITSLIASKSTGSNIRELLTVSPGVAYIYGYRVEKAAPTVLEVPRITDVEEVEAAKFTYLGGIASTNRTLLPTPLSTDNGTITLTFTGIPYLAGYINITATYKWGSSTGLIEGFVEAFQRGACSYTSPNTSLAPTSLRGALLTVISISMSGPNTISVFTPYRESLIGLSVVSDRHEVDVVESYLVGVGTQSNLYELGRKPVSSIVRVVADLQATLIPITRGMGRDELGDDTIFSIREVVQGTVKYVEGRDYTLYGQGWIDWRSGVGPATGTTYYVTYLYTQPLTDGIDYRLSGDRVELINSLRRPAPGNTFTVDYTYSLPQVGRVYMDRYGVIGYSLSPPSMDPVVPLASPSTISLATFTMVKGQVVIIGSPSRRLSVAELSNLMREYSRVNNSNYLPVAPLVDGISITPSYMTTPTRYLNVPIRYLGGGHPHKGLKVTLPYSIVPYAEQGRVTNVRTINPRPTPHLYISPRVVMYTSGGESCVHPCSHTNNQIPWASVTPTSIGTTPTTSPTISIKATGLDSNQSYAVFYAGRQVPYTVVKGNNTSSGIRPVKGDIEVYISAPPTPPGSYGVELRGSNNMTVGDSLVVMHPTYRQLGLDTTPLPNALAYSTVAAPLSQTLLVQEDIYISGIGIYLRYIEQDTKGWVTVETLETTPKVLGMGTMGPSITSKGEEVTNIPLEDPVYLQAGIAYKVCLYVHGGEMDVYTAVLGDRDLRDGTRIGSQLLHTGELMISNDGINEVPLPQEDLTHSLYRARYLTNPVVVLLGDYGLPDLFTPITAFCINGEDVVPPGTNILYEYNAGAAWLSCTRGSIICTAPTSSISIRATLYSSINTVSPALTLEGSVVTLYSNAEGGELGGSISVSHEKALLSFIKRGAQGTVSVSSSVIEGVWLPMVLVSTTPLNEEEIRYEYSITFESTVQESEYRISLWGRPLIREVRYDPR